MEFNSTTIWYWLILALVGFGAAILGYFFGKSDTPSVSDIADELNVLEIENAKLKADLDTCKKRLASGNPSSQKENSQRTLAVDNAPTFDATLAKNAMGKKIKENDLKIVEGIGPKIEGLFHNFNIKTWKELAETSADKCQEVLDSGGKRYRLHDPASWPMQAKMAQEGHWKQLAEWQEKHRAGKY